MPNYVTNIMTAKGSENDINKLINKIMTKNDNYEKIDFNKIIPMPEDLSIVSGGFDDNAIIAYLTNNCENLLTENDRRTAKKAGMENHISND